MDRNSFLLPLQNVPPDLSLCVFVIEQALSVRALQELMASGAEEGGAGGGGGGGGGLGSGHKTLLYGNAILLRHANSNMVTDELSGVMLYARCLSIVSISATGFSRKGQVTCFPCCKLHGRKHAT